MRNLIVTYLTSFHHPDFSCSLLKLHVFVHLTLHSLISRRRSASAIPSRRILRPQRAENPIDTLNGSDVPQDSTGVASTPPSSPTAAPSSSNLSSSSSVESKDEGKDESATTDILSGCSDSGSGGNNQNEDLSSRAATDPPASDGNKGLEDDQAAASSIAMEIETEPPLDGDSAPLLPIPATAPAVPSSSSSSSATSVDIQEDKKMSKDDGWQHSAMEVDKEVDVEMEMETEGEGEVEVEVKEAEKEVETDPNALDDATSGLELKSEITEVTSIDSADPVSATDEGVPTASDTTGVEESHLAVTESTKEGMIVDLLPVKSEIKEESAASSSSSTSVSSATSAPAAAPTPTPSVDSTIVKSEKVTAVVSTDASSKAKEPAAVVVPPIMPETLPRAPDTFSAIHSLRGFLDVGSSSLFAPSEPWVLATASLLMKRKLSKS